ncbi:MAG: TonB-dependent receptor domain-containing protein [Alistipes communis]
MGDRLDHQLPVQRRPHDARPGFPARIYFTLTQAKQDHGLTEDIVVRSRGEGRYGWLVGAFGFYRHRSMQAPVLFKEDGLEHLIADKAEQYTGLRPHFASDRMALDSDFRNPAWGRRFITSRSCGWDASTSRRGCASTTSAHVCAYLSSTDIDCTFGDGRITPFTERGTLHKSFVQLLPKAAAVYRIDDGNSLYASVAKGYKAGGFNTQMFSEVLQNSVMERMGVYWNRHYDIDRVVAYKPEKSWNFEVGSHFAFADGRIRGEATLFYILCRDQQLTVFPEGQTTGRMMTNAGRTRSRGGSSRCRRSSHTGSTCG